MKKKQFIALTASIYLLAFVVGFFAGNYLNIGFYFKVFVMDLVATLVVYIFTLIFKNTSIYDPYWSVAPILIGIYALVHYKNYTPVNIIFLLVLAIWGIRLTINWLIVCTGFDYEDWRYRHYRETLSKPLFHIVNFTGLQMVPTLVVYAALAPMFILFRQPNNYLALIGVAIMIFGIILEIVADHQMHQFLNETKEKVTCRKGLWNYSRHPNYLGENCIWVGTFVSMIAVTTSHWYVVAGMVAMICLFLFISIPLAEHRQLKRRSDYIDYKKTTSMILLLPHKKK